MDNIGDKNGKLFNIVEKFLMFHVKHSESIFPQMWITLWKKGKSFCISKISKFVSRETVIDLK